LVPFYGWYKQVIANGRTTEKNDQTIRKVVKKILTRQYANTISIYN
jgi:hypothetical protein